MIQEAETYKSDKDEHKKFEAKNFLENYVYNMREEHHPGREDCLKEASSRQEDRGRR